MPRATGGPSRRKPGAQAGKTGASGVERSSCSSLGRARHGGLLHGNACRRPAPVGQALIDLFSSLLAILMRRGLAFSATGMESRRTPLFTPDRGRPGNHHLRPLQLRHGPIHQNVSGSGGLSLPADPMPRSSPCRWSRRRLRRRKGPKLPGSRLQSFLRHTGQRIRSRRSPHHGPDRDFRFVRSALGRWWR